MFSQSSSGENAPTAPREGFDTRDPKELTKKTMDAALDCAADDLVMRKYLLDRRPKERNIVERKVPSIKAKERAQSSDESDDDMLDPELHRLEALRLRKLKEEWGKKGKGARYGDHIVDEVNENTFLDIVCKSSFDWVIVHFYHPEFKQCKIMDTMVHEIAERHSESKFARTNALNLPFFVTKLKVKVLPSLIVFYKGKVVDRLTGFEGIKNGDSGSLEKRLGKVGAIAVNGRRVANPGVLSITTDTLIDQV